MNELKILCSPALKQGRCSRASPSTSQSLPMTYTRSCYFVAPITAARISSAVAATC